MVAEGQSVRHDAAASSRIPRISGLALKSAPLSAEISLTHVRICNYIELIRVEADPAKSAKNVADKT